MSNLVFLSRQAKEALSGSSYSDYLVFNRAVQGWREQRDRRARQDYLDSHSLSGASLRFIQGKSVSLSKHKCIFCNVGHGVGPWSSDPPAVIPLLSCVTQGSWIGESPGSGLGTCDAWCSQ